MTTTQTKKEGDAGEKSGWLEIVRRQVGSLRFGVVQIVVHDSAVTQIDKTERVRLERARDKDLKPTETAEAKQKTKRLLAGQPEGE